MPYIKQAWVNDSSPLNATRMNYIEDGIYNAQATADAATGRIADPTPKAANDVLYYDGAAWKSGKLVNAMVDSSAAIAYSKLSLAGSIVNADISNAAAIAYAKLALSGSIVNADIASGAAIAYSKLSGVAKSIGYGTSLPGSPSDGDEYILVDDATTPTYQWRFRYHSGSGNTDKWEFVGGSPVIKTGTSGVSSTGYTDCGPTFTIPRSGQYMIAWTANTNGSADSSAIQGLVSLNNNGSISDSDAVMINGATVRTGGGGSQKQFTCTASTVVKVQCKGTGAGSISIPLSSMTVVPIRVS